MRLWKVGTSEHAQSQQIARDASRLPAMPATLMRRADDRARLATTMPCGVGERLLVSLRWPDGDIGFAVDVYAVHAERHLIDVTGWLEDDCEGAVVTVRKAQQ